MTLKVLFDGKQAGSKLQHGLLIAQERINRTVKATAKEASSEFLKQGRADIRRGGKFGRRWTEGLHADISQTPLATSISLYHDVPYFRVFEFGARIKGKPLLWIPLSFARDAQGVRARDFPGGLFRVERKGKAPLLLSRRTKEPKFFGKASVTIPRKFHLRIIARTVAAKLREIYSRNFKSETNG